jgi:hypothetical protein
MTFNKSAAVIAVFAGIVLAVASLARASQKISQPAGQASVEVFLASAYQRPSINLSSELRFIRQKFGSRITVNVLYYAEYDPQKGVFDTAGGKSETEETLRQAYIFRRYQDKYWDYVWARSFDVYNTEWAKSAKLAGISPGEIQDINKNSANTDSLKLLKDSYYSATEKGIDEFPAVFVNGKKAPQVLNLVDLASAINGALPQSARINYIDAVPITDIVPLEVSVIINPYGYGSDPYPAFSVIKNSLPQSAMKRLDYEDQAAMDIVDKLGIELLPACVIKKPVPANFTDKISELIKTGLLVQSKDPDFLVVPSTRIVYGLYLNRSKIENELSIFVMSNCPWGVETLAYFSRGNMSHTSALTDLNIRYHYIINVSTPSPRTLRDFTALHGSPEVEESARQLIINKYYPEKFADYIEARRTDIESTLFYKALDKAGIPEDAVRQKMDTEAVGLLAAEAELCKNFNVSVSPTFLWENRYMLDLDSLKLVQRFRHLDIKVEGSCH